MKVLVCGGRNYDDQKKVNIVLNQIHQDRGPITLVLHGGASGADMLGGFWARHCNIPVQVFKAARDTHGKAAGPIRNTRMLVEGKPDLVVAFPGGRGTANMVSQAKRA